jgi:hypothetical protein
MLDAGNPIEIDFCSSEISVFENGRSNSRYTLGYIFGEFEKIDTAGELYISVYFKRNTEMRWESITLQLNSGEKFFSQKLPAGLTVISLYIRLYGWVANEFELTNFKISLDEIYLGKFGGEPLLLLDEDVVPTLPEDAPDYEPFEIHIPQVGNVTANTATVVWATTHEATSRVIYGLLPETMTDEISDAEFVYYHSLTLIDLQLEEPYYCQVYSTSKDTGEEIYSDVILFFTGKEVTIQNIFGNIDAQFLIRQKHELFVGNTLGITENLLTLDPDGADGVINDAQFSTHTKVELEVSNVIGSEFDCSVTP